jgi:hypothetical protein
MPAKYVFTTSEGAEAETNAQGLDLGNAFAVATSDEGPLSPLLSASSSLLIYALLTPSVLLTFSAWLALCACPM